MKEQCVRLVILLIATFCLTAAGWAQSSIRRAHHPQLVDSYVAFIGDDDLYNSSGVRLTQPWAVIRQDRANYHAFNIRQRGDQGDDFFSSAVNRAALEGMLVRGSIAGDAAYLILRGGALIKVDVYGFGSRGDWVEVTVLN